MMEYFPEDKDRRVTQLRKGILELAIMGVLDGNPHYGYSLIRALLTELRAEFLSLVSLVQSQQNRSEEEHEHLSRIRIQSR